MKSTMVDTGHLSDDEFIDVENDNDSEQVSQNVVEENEKSMDLKIKCAPLQTDRKTSSQNKKTTAYSTNMNKKELCDILFEVMNKIFSARVVLTRLPDPVVKEKEPAAEKPNTRNKNKRIFVKKSTRDKNKKKFIVKETAVINERTTYVRKCPKCQMPPFVRKTKFCLDCKIDLIYECQKCHKHFNNYKGVQAHIDSKCFIRGYYHCPVCDFKTIAPAKVKSHVERLHPSVKYDKETLKWTDAKTIKKHNCSLCAKEFDNHESLNMHIPLCNRAQEIIELANYNKQTEWNKNFQKMIIKFCPKCKEDMKVYEGGVSSLQPCQKCGSAMKFRCSGCSKEYEVYSGCRYHTTVGCNPMKIDKPNQRHSSKNAIHCPHCQKPFVDRVWFKKHMLKCEGPTIKPRNRRTYKHLKATCERCCKVQRIFDRRKICKKCKSSLRFQCKTCDKSFNADYDSLCGHLKTLFDEAKYVCNDCGLGTISRDALLIHLRICNKKSFHCDQCNFSTTLKCTIRHHMLIKHPILKP